MIFKHIEGESVNFNFNAEGEFVNRAPLGMEQIGEWKLLANKQLIVVRVEGENDFYKVIKLENDELHLFVVRGKQILKFKR